MAQKRVVVAATESLLVETVRTLPHQAGWSPVYCAPAPRLVLPESGLMRLRAGKLVTTVDELTAFWLEGDARYQLGYAPELGSRVSVVLSRQDARPPGAGASGWLMTPAALLRWRLRLRQLADGRRNSQDPPLLSGCTPLAAVCEPASVATVRRILTADPGVGLGLGELAECAGTSPFHLTRQFRRYLGLSLHQYRLQARMARALWHIEHQRTQLADLAHALGFSGHSHFGDVFLQHFGLTPSHVRALLRH